MLLILLARAIENDGLDGVVGCRGLEGEGCIVAAWCRLGEDP